MSARPARILAGLLPLFVAGCWAFPDELPGQADAAGADAEQVPQPTCALKDGDPLRQPVETLCDGVDNDCDGLTDWLLPVAANQCAAPGKGACAQGLSACVGGKQACLAPPAIAEARNGSDDDCDGLTDEAEPSRPVTLSARVLAPPALFKESSRAVPGTIEILEQAGIAYYAPNASDPTAKLDWYVGLTELDQHALAIVPGYVTGWDFLSKASPDGTYFAPLKAWVEQGGVLVVSRPVPPDPKEPLENQEAVVQMMDFLGLQSGAAVAEVTRLRVEGTVPATLGLDSREERDIQLSKDPKESPEVFVYQAKPGTQVFGTAHAGGKAVGAAWLRRPLGKGAVYTLGWDPLEPGPSDCYVNCFDPGRDLYGLLLRAMLREAGGGHSVVKHTVPGPQSTVLLMTHDIDAPDSHNPGKAWGEAGSLDLARRQKALGVRGTYFVTTDYVVGYYNPSLIPELCGMGMCPEGAHSVQHLEMAKLPMGTCPAKMSAYNAKKPTFCGEMDVSLEILNGKLPKDQPVKAWRSPYLSVHDKLYAELAARGIRYESSYALGDIRTNFPVWAGRHPWLDVMHGEDVWTFPIVQEDGLGDYINGKEVRYELQPKNRPEFHTRWLYSFLHNLRNNAWNVHLLHPSYGIGVGPSNLKVKLDALDDFIKAVKPLDVLVDTIVPLGDFWRGRDNVTVTAAWDPQKGYVGKLQVGGVAAPNFSLEFADRIAAFTCQGADPKDLKQVDISGQRVVFRNPLPAGSTCAFVATVGP